MSRAQGRAVSLLAVAVCAAAPLYGQGSPGVMDNETVVRMLVEGTPESEVLREIATAPHVAFDLAPDVIRELKAVGVSESVLAAMRRRHVAAGPTRQTSTAPVSTGRLEIAFASAQAKRSNEPVVFQMIRKTPRWAADQMGMLQRPEVEDLAFFLLCTRPDHVPDHWQDSTELKNFVRHEKLLFRSGSHPDKSHGFDVVALDLSESLALEVHDGDHRVVAGIAARTGADWHVVGSGELKHVEVRPDRTTRLLVKLSGKVVGSHMVGFKEEQVVSVTEVTGLETAP